MGVNPIVANITTATIKGDVLILVPALIAPLYLISVSLVDNPNLRKHQTAVLACSLLLAGGTLLVYVTKIANTVADSNFLLKWSEWGFFAAFVLLYFYFLQTHLQGKDALPALQEANAPLTEELSAMRRGK